MEIVMARGDLETRSFQIMNRNSEGAETPFTDTLDEAYFTVKKLFTDTQYKFQKRLTDGGIVSLGSGRYQFRIEPSDTDGLMFGDYVFDIELVIDGELKKTFVGQLILTGESTHACNEVTT